VSCPRCGGEARSPIATGFWRCESLITRTQPDRRGGSIPERVSGVCGYSYQEGPHATADSPVCDCGTFAIGKCRNCQRPVCGDHSRLEQEGRVCQHCLPAVLQRREQERKAQVAAIPTAGVEQLIALCRGQLKRDHQAENSYSAFSESVLLVNENGDRYAVRNPMQGQIIAQGLTELKARPIVNVIKKSFGREERIDQGWHIWSYTTQLADPDSWYPTNLAPEDCYYMRRDGTVEKFLPKYHRGKDNSVLLEVIPADWYWCSSVVWQVFASAWLHPDHPVSVSGTSPRLPLYAEYPTAWKS
jgi:hypothetical protein